MTYSPSSFQNQPSMDSDQFAQLLVEALLGQKIEDIEPSQRLEKKQECLDIFSKYITAYVEKKFGYRDAIRLKIAQTYHDSSIFEKFADLTAKFEEAYQAFLQEIIQKNNSLS